MTPGPFPYTSDDFRRELARTKRNRVLIAIAVIVLIVAIALVACFVVLR